MLPTKNVPRDTVRELTAVFAQRKLDYDTFAVNVALHEAKGNQSIAATILGMHRNTFAKQLKRLGVDPLPFRVTEEEVTHESI